MFFIGIDIGGTNIKIGLVDSDGKIYKKISIKTLPERSAEGIVLDIANNINKLIDDVKQEEKLSSLQIEGIGIGCPGVINSKAGTVIYNNNIGWKNFKIKEEIQKYFDVKICVANDANVAALGEQRFGAGKKYKNSILITLGTGIGSGIIIDGKLFEGHMSAGCEIGHMVIVKNGLPCSCGRYGCFEKYASASAFVKRIKERMEENKDSLLWKYVDGDLDKVNGDVAFICAKMGDTLANELKNEFIDYLSEGIENLINILRPEVIIIGGGISELNDELLLPIKNDVLSMSYGPDDYAPVEIVVATLKNNAGILGAAALVMEDAFLK